MDSLTDQQLLRDYSERRSEPAFAELVRRHVDLVYSAALRMVCDSHLAEDVTQGAFVALAQNARHLSDRPVLSGWLHRTARNLAANIVRSDVRRRAREQEAAAMNELLSAEPDANWEKIAPHLDVALDNLNELDRDALLLRYFERKSAHEIAQAFGISDDAAQKRVTRAVERLREFFSKRGVTIGASGLVVLISANAVHSAPIALAAAISTTAILAGTTGHAFTAITATKAIAMTTMQKAFATVTVAILAGAGLYQIHQTTLWRNKALMLRQQQYPLQAQIRQLQNERNEATNRLAELLVEDSALKANSHTAELLKLRGEVAQLRESASSTTNDSRAAMIKSWLAREDQLRRLVAQNPEKAIPEFQLLSGQQWLDAAMNAQFQTEKDASRTLANLRHTAENNLVSQMHNALQAYMKDKNGQFPTDLSELGTYFGTPIDAAILGRWEITPAKTVPGVGVGDMIITQKAPIDPDLDQQWAVGQRGYGSSTYKSSALNTARSVLTPALEAYLAANNGQTPTDPSQIRPYLTTPEQQAAYQILIQKSQDKSTSP
jgi:RNA polymerase sigma factor (sigma-70 family)